MLAFFAGLLLLQLTLAVSISACAGISAFGETTAAEHSGMTMAGSSVEGSANSSAPSASCDTESDSPGCPESSSDGSCQAMTCAPAALGIGLIDPALLSALGSLVIGSSDPSADSRTILPELPPPRT